MTATKPKPRTGKSQFFPLMQQIQDRLALGETNRQIHDDLMDKELVKISYDQFSRYIRQHLKKAKPTVITQRPSPATQLAAPQEHPFNFKDRETANGERRRISDKDFHSSVPDLRKIYGTPDKTND